MRSERLKNLILPTRGWFGLVIFLGMKYYPVFMVIMIPSRGRVRPYPTKREKGKSSTDFSAGW